MSHMPGELFNLYLHQNYVDFFTEVDDLVRASEFLSFADIISGDWNVRPFDLNVFVFYYFLRIETKFYSYSELFDMTYIT